MRRCRGLKDAQQKLERNQGGRGERDMQAAQRQAAELAQEQKQVASDVNGLEQAGASRDEKAQGLAQRKDAMDAKVADLQSQLERLANGVRRDEKDAARKLDEAAGSIRDKRIREEIRYSKNQLKGSPGQYARAMEDDIASKLDALEKKVNEAAGAMGKSAKQDSMARAADKARDLVRGMESMDQRMRDRAQNGQRGRDGQQNGQQGREGQQGQQGQQGQSGQQGKAGQQGQSGQQASRVNRASRVPTVSRGQQGGQANSGGSPNGPAGYGDARNWGGYGYGRWDPNDIRQWRGEYRNWANDADALRRQLQAAGTPVRELDDIIRDLRMFDNDRLFADPQGLEKLQAAAIDRLKKFEFALRRKTENGNDSLSLSGSDQVPDGFRQAIEEYYRSLAKNSSNSSRLQQADVRSLKSLTRETSDLKLETCAFSRLVPSSSGSMVPSRVFSWSKRAAIPGSGSSPKATSKTAKPRSRPRSARPRKKPAWIGRILAPLGALEFESGGRPLHVEYFLVELLGDAAWSEHRPFAWGTYDETCARIEFPSARKLLTAARAQLDRLRGIGQKH
jgi:hypothetical protein